MGVEIAGAMKNIYAIGGGIIEGGGYGYNTKTALVTRGTFVLFFNNRKCKTSQNFMAVKIQILYGVLQESVI